MKQIKYITYYDLINSKVKRNYALSSVNKVDYIIDTLVKLGYSVDIISASGVVEAEIKYHKGESITIDSFRTLKLFPSVGGRSLLFRIIRRVLSSVQLFFWLLFNTKKNENVILYHSLGYVNAVYLAKKIKNFKLILEVEEVYQDVRKQALLDGAENRLFSIADKYIFPTILLDEKLNTKKCPSIIIHGTYKLEKFFNARFEDDKIHVVYAGTFDPNKGGVMAAAAAAGFLSDKYHVHIIGFGSEFQIKKLKEMVAEVNLKDKAKLTYDGLLSGEEYTEFLQKCDIGLSTQNPDAKFNDTSFPSKILSYLSNGLCVLSINIKAVVQSNIGSFICYYESQCPESIAKAIEKINIKECKEKSTGIIKELDKRFSNDLASFF